MPRIISASRRTDLPAFHGDWFMEQVREEEVTYQHPFNGKPVTVSLKPEDVTAVVFWSKNFSPFLPHLEELDRQGFSLLFHFTITGLPSYLEERVPPPQETVETFRYLAHRYSPRQVLWRYDPIFLGEGLDFNYHRKVFSRLCRALEGYTKRCYISFVQSYRKVDARLAARGITLTKTTSEEQLRLAEELSDLAAGSGIKMYACCSDQLVGEKVEKARCIDADLLHFLFGNDATRYRRRPSRSSCGCSESTDIGRYNTCLHRCVYCYANR